MKRLAVLGNHLPRQCGIATFTAHIADALATELPDVDTFVLAMNDAGRRHAYPPRVRFEIADGDLGSYRRAADFLNVNHIDVLSVQHEYGIFGGKAGAHVLALLRTWGGHKIVLPARRGSWWDANKIGLSPPLIETPRGWLMLYHGVRRTAAGCL